ncbi:16S rRNA (cytidine(1402)-2'-O)-methyltransferase [Poseidonocella sp. HB161398]|uniref:16S rRNA (cytidine(1402)-2'-O)-methyltransferase n=1 Tax=Poseidonocella sp. HB161398 TaxID=2320855 RepID=UPI0011098D6D|nr:16S rRNA (cytidine(1402)-2'-O)-methyltransferase [Poseidonocella sp. HB161398]
MNYQQTELQPGLYLVATPIGHARDITLRALDVLAAADILAAEDTRTLQKLLQIHGIPREGRALVAYHDHSSDAAVQRLAGEIRQGRSVAYTSEAGSPLISDPGYRLVAELAREGLPVTVIPGPSAAVAALSLAGLPTDRFLFLGFPPAKAAARLSWLADQAHSGATQVIYESPRRIGELLEALCETHGPGRPAALCRELTKTYETVLRGTVSELAEMLRETPARGECVLVVAGTEAPEAGEEDVETALVNAMERLSMKDAVKEVAESLGMPRKTVYQMALSLRQED